MNDNGSNDNDQTATAKQQGGSDPHCADPHGQAAILLVESLLHGLIARSVLSVSDAIEIVNVAAEVKADMAEDLGDSPEALRKSLDLLEAISTSLSFDAPP